MSRALRILERISLCAAALVPLTHWNLPGPKQYDAPREVAPWPPAAKGSREAWAEIAMLEDRRTPDTSRLVGILQSNPDSLVRWRVCRAFARLQDTTTVSPLISILNQDSCLSVRREAAFALGQIGSREAVLSLVYAARPGRDRALRARAIEAMGKIGGKQAVGGTVPWIKDPDPEISREVGIACWRLADSSAVSLLTQAAGTTKDPLTRAYIAYALEKVPMPPGTVTTLETLARDPDLVVRAYAVRALGRQKSPLALGPLVEACRDRDFRIRISAVRALGLLADSSAAPQALGALSDDHPAVRETAAATLAQLKSRDALAALRKALGDSDPAVRLAAARALAALAPNDGWPDLRPLLADSERWVRAGVLEALGGLSGEEPLLMLKKVAAGVRPIGGNASFEERASAFGGLAARKTLAGRDEMRSGMHDSNWGVAAAAADAAGAVGDSLLTDDLAWLARHNPDPREVDVPLTVYGAFEALGPAALRGTAPRDTVERALVFGFTDAEPRVRTAARSAYGAVFGPDARREAEAKHPAPAWTEGVLADYRAALAEQDSTGAVGRITGAEFTTARGVIRLVLDPREAPLTVKNFATLADKGYFDGLHWHRVVPYFVIQDGDPLGTGNGGPGYSFRCEYNELRYDTGALGMALSGKDTGGSQYFITLSPQPHLDGRYTIFGHVVEGQDVVESMRRGDRIEKVKIVRR